MARPKEIVYGTVSAAAYPWIPLSWREAFFNITYQVTVGNQGALSYKVQGTIDNVLAGTANPGSTAAPVSAIAFDLVSGKTGDFMGAWGGTTGQGPLTAIRLNVVSVSAGVGAASFRILQSDGM